MKTKVCSKCGEEKILSEFQKDSRYNLGVRGICLMCCRKESKEYSLNHKDEKKNYYLLNREKFLELNKQWYKDNLIKIKQYLKENKETILEKKKIFRTIHKEEIKSYMKIYRQEHAQEILNWTNKYNKQKRKNNKEFKILTNYRTRINNAIKNNIKRGHTLELLGCSIDFLKNYIEKHFTEGMNWKNYGRKGWHIDHIKPCASFDMSKASEQKKCFHYTNLQPLWWYDNINKGSKT